MRRWSVAALPLFFVGLGAIVSACSTSAVPPEAPPPTVVPRPTPSGPTPALQVARAVSSPSAVAGGFAQGGFGGQPFVLQSTAFSDGATLPPEYTCDGGAQAPPLTWSGAPPATAAYALIEEDADKTSDPGMPFVQWLVYNMPIAVNQLAAGTPPRPLLSNGAQQGLNSNQMVGYLGACPSQGDPPHHFTFLLFALDGYVTLETGAAYTAVHDALTGHTIGQTQLTATFQR